MTFGVDIFGGVGDAFGGFLLVGWGFFFILFWVFCGFWFFVFFFLIGGCCCSVWYVFFQYNLSDEVGASTVEN